MTRRLLTAFVLFLLVPAIALAAHISPCARTAQGAFMACHHDAWDDLLIARAICVNVSDSGERTECFVDARATWSEDWASCAEVREARLDVCAELGGGRYDPSFDGADFVHPDEIVEQNPFRSLAAGHTAVLTADDGEELIVVHVTDQVKMIDGVPCRVVVDAAVEVSEEGGEVEYEAVEVTDDWYAYRTNGDVWYCGELSRNFEDGELTDIDGSFKAGRDGAKAGILIRFSPSPAGPYRQEFALGEAEDLAEVLSSSASPSEENEAFPCDGDCLLTRDYTPLEPGEEENKYYLPGTGFVLALKFEDGVQTDDREELACSHDSLAAALADEDCGIANAEALAEALCKLAPEAFCID